MRGLSILVNALTIIVAIGLLMFSIVPMLFCDSGPTSACETSSLIIASGPIISLFLVVYASYQLKNDEGKYATSNMLAWSMSALIVALLPIVYFVFIAPMFYRG